MTLMWAVSGIGEMLWMTGDLTVMKMSQNLMLIYFGTILIGVPVIILKLDARKAPEDVAGGTAYLLVTASNMCARPTQRARARAGREAQRVTAPLF